jgi:hypothetical protein
MPFSIILSFCPMVHYAMSPGAHKCMHAKLLVCRLVGLLGGTTTRREIWLKTVQRHTSWKFPWQKTTGGKISVITLCREQTCCCKYHKSVVLYRQRTSVGCLTHWKLEVYTIIIFNFFLSHIICIWVHI